MADKSAYDGTVDVQFDNDVAIVTMRCGENRFNEDFVKRFHTAFDDVLRNSKCIGMILIGHGKFFSNGMDVDWLKDKSMDQLREFAVSQAVVIKRLLTFPMPTVAAISGHSFAAGALLPLYCDHVIMQNNRGWWCLNEVFLNLRFSSFVVEFIRTKIPSRSRSEASILGRRYTGDEARDAGIVDESCPPDEMLPRAQAWIKKVVPPAGFDRDHLKVMKEDTYQKLLALFEGDSLAQFKSSL